MHISTLMSFFCTPRYIEKSIFAFWFFEPCFVVTSITPLPPDEPYIACDEASFSTSICSMSFWLIEPISPGIPSIIYIGPGTPLHSSFFVIVLIPLTRTVMPAPGIPELLIICTPAALPCKACNAPVLGVFTSSSLDTEAIAPVRSLFFCTP